MTNPKQTSHLDDAFHAFMTVSPKLTYPQLSARFNVARNRLATVARVERWQQKRAESGVVDLCACGCGHPINPLQRGIYLTAHNPNFLKVCPNPDVGNFVNQAEYVAAVQEHRRQKVCERSREKYRINRDKICKRQRARYRLTGRFRYRFRYAKNRDKILAQRRLLYWKNPSQNLEKQRQYAAKNDDKVSLNRKRYYLKHKTYHQFKYKIWAHKNKENLRLAAIKKRYLAVHGEDAFFHVIASTSKVSTAVGG